MNVGVTSGGDVFGGSAVTFSDVLGDKQFNLYAASISQYRTLSFSYLNLARRFNYAVQAYSQTQFFYGALEGVFYDPERSRAFVDRDFAVATRTVRGGSVFGIWPLNRYRRVELVGGVLQYNEEFNDPTLQDVFHRTSSSSSSAGSCSGRDSTFRSASTSSRKRPSSASSVRSLATRCACRTRCRPTIGDTLGRQTADVDARYYLRLGGSGLLALRAPRLQELGRRARLHVFRRQLRDARLRVPRVHRLESGVPERRAALPVHRSDADADRCAGRNPRRAVRQHGRRALRRPAVQVAVEQRRHLHADRWLHARTSGGQTPVFGPPTRIDGLRLVDARASYGIGLETFALGFPIHFDWAWRTLLNKDWEDLRFAASGGSSAFRKPQFAMWIGYDF